MYGAYVTPDFWTSPCLQSLGHAQGLCLATLNSSSLSSARTCAALHLTYLSKHKSLPQLWTSASNFSCSLFLRIRLLIPSFALHTNVRRTMQLLFLLRLLLLLFRLQLPPPPQKLMQTKSLGGMFTAFAASSSGRVCSSPKMVAIEVSVCPLPETYESASPTRSMNCAQPIRLCSQHLHESAMPR